MPDFDPAVILAAIEDPIQRAIGQFHRGLLPAYISRDDLAQEIRIQVLRSLPRYQRGVKCSIEAWAYRIGQHVIASAYRSAYSDGRPRTTPMFDDFDVRNLEDDEQWVAAMDARASVARVAEAIGAQHWSVLFLRFICDLSSAQAARLLKTTPGAARLRQFRALACSRHVLGVPSGGDGQ